MARLSSRLNALQEVADRLGQSKADRAAEAALAAWCQQTFGWTADHAALQLRQPTDPQGPTGADLDAAILALAADLDGMAAWWDNARASGYVEPVYPTP